jgi:hypothetical protein
VHRRPTIILVDHAFFHHKKDVFGLPDILHRIARHRHHICQFARRQRCDFVRQAVQIRVRRSSVLNASIARDSKNKEWPRLTFCRAEAFLLLLAS